MPDHHWTPRETEVVRLVTEGLTARQIARRLVLAPKTVENHIQRAKRKVDAPNRAALVCYALRHGLVDQGSGGVVDEGQVRLGVPEQGGLRDAGQLDQLRPGHSASAQFGDHPPRPVGAAAGG